MTIPITNVTFSSIQTEFGGSPPISLSEYYKGGAYVPANQATQTGVSNPAPAAVATSGAINVSAFRNLTKRYTVTYVIAANVDRKSIVIGTTAPSTGTYVAGLSDITITVNSGVYVYSTTTATPALTTSGGTTGDVVTLVNNGFIMGCGGVGAGWNGLTGNSTYLASGGGGVAISVGYNMSITNNAYIGGGGGGGGAAVNGTTIAGFGGGGGGAGGGPGGNASNGSASATGGTAGGLGGAGSNGTVASACAGGGGGGRIFAVAGGAAVSGTSATAANTLAGNGAGGGGGGSMLSYTNRGAGAGGGGGWGAAGGAGIWNSTAGSGTLTYTSGSGGASGVVGGTATITSTGTTGTTGFYGGSAGGNAISKNGRTVTINSGGANIFGAQV
jgi:hypothetical protein